MVKTWSIVLGIGLGILWLVGLGSANSVPWLTWLDGVAALCAFVIAASVGDRSTRGARMGSNVILALGLFALWIIGLAAGAPTWQSWWTFAFGCAFLLLGLGSGSARQVSGPVRTPEITDREIERERFRKGA